MQRYFLENYPDRDAEMDEHPTGYWVKYSDACAEINKAVEANNTAVLAVVSSEKRVKELEAALGDYYKNCPCDNGMCPGCVQARKLLEAPHEP